MKFEDAVKIILEYEGGHVINPKDPGGETNFGISKRAYPKLDIGSLTAEDATVIYKRDYWDKLKISDLPEALRLAVFDCAVNQGPHFAISSLQRCLGVAPDGLVGEKTIQAAMSQPNISTVTNSYIQSRIKNYMSSKRWPEFGAGWAARLIDLTLKIKK